MNDIDRLTALWPLITWTGKSGWGSEVKTGESKDLISITGLLERVEGGKVEFKIARTMNRWYASCSEFPKTESGPFGSAVDAAKDLFTMISKSDELEAEMAMLGMSLTPWVKS